MHPTKNWGSITIETAIKYGDQLTVSVIWEKEEKLGEEVEENEKT